jgi:transcriptional regulator with XRE-family HTH domain
MNPESIYPEIGALIRRRRKKLKLTQEQLAGHLGISRASVANMEIGRQKVLVHQIYALASALQVTPSDLLPSTQRLTGPSEWEALPLPDNLNSQQKEQITRLLSGPQTEADRDKDAKNATPPKR